MLAFRTVIILVCSLAWFNQGLASDKAAKKCLYIASYSPGYDWQDRIETSLKSTLSTHCQIDTFYMKSKKVVNFNEIFKIGLKAKAYIENQNPDVVIVSDDNAVKYILEPHFKDHKIPFVFCGVHDAGQPYGLPYTNTTGIIEKSPLESLLKTLIKIQPSHNHVAFLSTKGTSANKVLSEYESIAESLNLQYTSVQVKNQSQWRFRYKQLQEDPDVDLILFSNYTALPKWDHKKNMQWILQHNHKLSIATARVMMPYVALGLAKRAEEHGNWAGLSAIAILDGVKPNLIKVVPNQQFQFWINPKMIKPFLKELPEQLITQAAEYENSNNKASAENPTEQKALNEKQ